MCISSRGGLRMLGTIPAAPIRKLSWDDQAAPTSTSGRRMACGIMIEWQPARHLRPTAQIAVGAVAVGPCPGSHRNIQSNASGLRRRVREEKQIRSGLVPRFGPLLRDVVVCNVGRPGARAYPPCGSQDFGQGLCQEV